MNGNTETHEMTDLEAARIDTLMAKREAAAAKEALIKRERQDIETAINSFVVEKVEMSPAELANIDVNVNTKDRKIVLTRKESADAGGE